MNIQVVLSLLSLLGTLIGSLCGILVSNKLTNYRIQQLEIKVDKHNNFASRLPTIEKEIELIQKELDRKEDVR